MAEAALAATPTAPPPPAPPPVAAAPPPAPAPAAAPPASPAGAASKEQPPAPAPQAKTPPAEIEIKLPEGTELDQAKQDRYKAKVKELGLDPKAAASLAEWYVTDDMVALKDQVQKTRDADAAALKSDPEFGGARFDRTVADARSALQQFGGEEVSKLFEAFGIDRHPGLAKMFARIRAAIAEDSTSSRAPKPVPDVQPKPQTQTQRQASRYAKKK